MLKLGAREALETGHYFSSEGVFLGSCTPSELR